MTTAPNRRRASEPTDYGPCNACGATDPACSDTDAGCCDVCRATGGCSHGHPPTGIEVTDSFGTREVEYEMDPIAAVQRERTPSPSERAHDAPAAMDRPAYELVRLLEAMLDDADQVTDRPKRPNRVTVWAVRHVLEDFGGKRHRWSFPRCEDCDHFPAFHNEGGGCWLDCDCALSRDEALNGRDESIDEDIERAMREESTDGYLP